jgi:glutathione S-transferase
MKLFYAPLACSLAAHIACREAGLDVDLVRVDFRTKHVETGGDLFGTNPMGQVPTLELGDGRVLTENVAVLLYLAERGADAPGPSAGDEPADRYELTRWLAFVSTELHKKILAAIYAPTSPEPVKEHARASSERALRVVSDRLAAREHLVGDGFTPADAYLFWALTLLPRAGVALDAFAPLTRYHALHAERESVKQALAFEREQHARPMRSA